MAAGGGGEAPSAFAQRRGAAARSDSSDEDGEPKRRQFKVVVLGDGAVGKTSICHRVSSDTFAHAYKQTVGTDFFLKQFELPDGEEVVLQIWDIGGQSLGSKMIGKYLAGAHAVVFVYDITNVDSFRDLDDWYGVYDGAAGKGGAAAPMLVLMGNKTDLSHIRKVSLKDHEAFAASKSMRAFLTSAKTGDVVIQSFLRLACELAGVKIGRTEVQARSKIIQAEVVNHERDDATVAAPDVAKAAADAAKASSASGASRCVIA